MRYTMFIRSVRVPGRFAFSLLLLIAVLPGLGIAAEENLPRTWTNSLGVKVEGTFLREDGGQVTLLLKNGRTVTMPMDKLSAEDQDYIRRQTSIVPAATPAAVAGGTPAAGTPAPQGAQATAAPGAGRKKSILLRPTLIHAPDPRVRPKAEIYVPFPELGKSRTDEPMGMRIRVPGSYSPDRPVPLLLWLAGGDGTSRFNAAQALVDQEQFVLVAMNYPAAVPQPAFATTEGRIGEIWDLHEKMLAKLQEMIPNIDPRLRVVVGFSNGAHVIGGSLSEQIDGLSHYFNVFVLIEGGDAKSFEYPALPGRYFYVASGALKEGDGKEFNMKLANAARKAGMKVEAHMMEGVGHDFPDLEQARVKSWLENTVIPAQLAQP